MRRSLLAVVLLLAAAPAALADSWMPFPDQRVVSPSGRHYAVVRSEERAVTYELVRRRDGAGPIEPVEDRWGENEITRDPEDEVVEKGVLPQRPLRIRVLDTPGIVCFEQYGRVGFGDSLTVVLTGKPVVRRSLTEIVGEEAANRFRTEHASVSSIWWYAGFLVDEERERILVVTVEDGLVSVSFAGEVGAAAKGDLLQHLRIGSQEERSLALEVAARIRPDGLGPDALALAADESGAVGIRLRAAVAAKRTGEKVPLEALFLTSVAKGKPGEVRSYATAHLGEMIGVAAIPVLRRLMRGTADNDVWGPAMEGLTALGDAAVPTLIEMVGEAGETPDYRGGAAHVLGKLKPAAAVPALLAAVGDDDDYVANAAVNAVIAIEPPDLSARLAEVLQKGSTQDARIASYFESHPYPLARAALEAALERAEPDSYAARTIRAALKALD